MNFIYEYNLIQKRYTIKKLIISRLVGSNEMYLKVLRSSRNIPIYMANTQTTNVHGKIQSLQPSFSEAVTLGSDVTFDEFVDMLRALSRGVGYSQESIDELFGS